MTGEKQNITCQQCQNMEQKFDEKKKILRIMHHPKIKATKKKAKEFEVHEIRHQAKSNRLEAWNQELRAEKITWNEF